MHHVATNSFGGELGLEELQRVAMHSAKRRVVEKIHQARIEELFAAGGVETVY